MVKISPTYTIGDTVVHRTYGIGKIDDIEIKPLNGIQVECYKVNTENSIYWFPTDSADNPRVHPVASEELIQEAIEILQTPPPELKYDPVQLNERIDDVWVNGDILEVCRLIRDLTVFKTENNLIRSQDKALNNLKEYLVREWAASSRTDKNKIRIKLRAYLAEGSA
jgi:RNA polymerase-interacting CarD/CdnL/TRCF family regulator